MEKELLAKNEEIKSKALELIVKLLMEKKDFKVIKELTQIILNWIGEEKDFIEKLLKIQMNQMRKQNIKKKLKKENLIEKWKKKIY